MSWVKNSLIFNDFIKFALILPSWTLLLFAGIVALYVIEFLSCFHLSLSLLNDKLYKFRTTKEQGKSKSQMMKGHLLII